MSPELVAMSVISSHTGTACSISYREALRSPRTTQYLLSLSRLINSRLKIRYSETYQRFARELLFSLSLYLFLYLSVYPSITIFISYTKANRIILINWMFFSISGAEKMVFPGVTKENFDPLPNGALPR